MSSMFGLQHGLRRLVRARSFSLVSILTLGLGIGATVAIFSVVRGVLLKPLPYDHPENLVGLWNAAPGLGFDEVNQSAALYFTMRDHATTLQGVALWDDNLVTITGRGEPEEVTGMMVTAGALPLLGVRPELGRLFLEEDDTPVAPRVAILGHDYWQRRLGGAADVVGQQITISGRPHEIVGVLPDGFRLLRYDAAVYYPARFDRAKTSLGQFNYQGFGRLGPGVTAEQAMADLDRLLPICAEEFSRGLSLQMLQEAKFTSVVRPLIVDVVGDVGRVLWVLLGTVGIVLAVACANVANLFLVRAEGRVREFALRLAIGASRVRLLGHFVAESLVLCTFGGILGLGLAWGCLKLLLRIAPATLPRLWEIGLDGPVLVFTLAVALGCALLLGIVPALRLGTTLSFTALKEGGRGGGAGRERQWVRAGLVVAQVALALVLLVGSGLMVRSFFALRSVEPGFDRPEEVLTFRLSVPFAEIPDQMAVLALERSIVESLRTLPGVVAVSGGSSIPMDSNNSNDALWFAEFPVPEGQLPPIRRFKFVLGDYLETLGRPMVAGRSIEWADLEQQRPVVVITENLAREYWSDPQMALGQRVSSGNGERWREVVGVVGDVFDDGVDQKAPAVVYFPAATRWVWSDDEEPLRVERSLAYLVRARGVRPEGLLGQVQAAVWGLNSNLPLARPRTLEEIYDRSLARTSFTLVMLGIAAAVALLLGIIGLHGVISYIVSLRRREIGLRLALGAQRLQVRGMMVRYGLGLAAAGVLVGAVVAAALTRLMRQLLFGVQAADPFTFIAVAALLATVVGAASYFASASASRVDPMVALRAE